MAHKADLAIIHIGAPHAGSTRVQAAFSGARDRLLSDCVLYPRSLGRTAHLRFAAAMAPVWRDNGPKRALGLRSWRAIWRFRKALAAEFAAEIADTCPRVIVISAEQLLADADPAHLKTALAPVAARVEIVAWLRHQEGAIVASWLNGVKLGGGRDFSLARPRRDPLDYAARLRPWQRVFDASALHIKPYEAGNDPAEMLAAMAGTAWRPRQDQCNASIGGAPLEFMQRLNAHIPRYADGQHTVNPIRADLDAAMENAPLAAPPPTLSAMQRAAIAARYAKGNARILRDWGRGDRFFPEQATEVPEAAPLGVDDAIALAAHLWTHKQRQINRLRQQAQGAIQPPCQAFPSQSNAARR